MTLPPSPEPVDLGNLFDEHAPYLCRAAHRLTGSRELAEDVVQEVFLTIARREHPLEQGPGLRTWLYRVTLNISRHRRRAHTRYAGALERSAEPEPPESPTPDAALLRARRARRIHSVVQQLSEKQREVFVLFELEELDGVAVAELLEIPLNTVWSRLRLAREAFRELWLEDGGERP